MAKVSRRIRASKNVYLTAEGLKEAQSELEFLRTTKRTQVSQRIQNAIEFGDISENAEYDAALDEQALVENRITYLEEILRDADVIADSVHKDIVDIGSTVTVDMDGSVDEFTIVGKPEANPVKKKISNESPIGKALLGAKRGEVVEVVTPVLSYKCKILKIR